MEYVSTDIMNNLVFSVVLIRINPSSNYVMAVPRSKRWPGLFQIVLFAKVISVLQMYCGFQIDTPYSCHPTLRRGRHSIPRVGLWGKSLSGSSTKIGNINQRPAFCGFVNHRNCQRHHSSPSPHSRSKQAFMVRAHKRDCLANVHVLFCLFATSTIKHIRWSPST